MLGCSACRLTGKPPKSGHQHVGWGDLQASPLNVFVLALVNRGGSGESVFFSVVLSLLRVCVKTSLPLRCFKKALHFWVQHIPVMRGWVAGWVGGCVCAWVGTCCDLCIWRIPQTFGAILCVAPQPIESSDRV